MITKKPALPDVRADFEKYYEANPEWGHLHIVLADGNVDDSSVRYCQQQALENDDAEAARLADILLHLSKTQRLKLHATSFSTS